MAKNVCGHKECDWIGGCLLKEYHCKCGWSGRHADLKSKQLIEKGEGRWRSETYEYVCPKCGHLHDSVISMVMKEPNRP